MIDPLTSLAFGMHSTKGAYALLLGSGVSRAAEIPTGWDVVVDLTRKVAAMNGATCGADPAKWFRETFGAEPNYSVLLDRLAKTQTERQQLLRGYFEPTADELGRRVKTP